MTVVVYRDGVLAADTLVTRNGLVQGHAEKIRRLPDGRLVGACGWLAELERFVGWLEAGSPEPRPELDESFCGLVVGLDGEVLLYDDGLTPFRVSAMWHALGSGHVVAVGALAMGASAVEAVEVAIARDVWSGGRVSSLRLVA